VIILTHVPGGPSHELMVMYLGEHVVIDDHRRYSRTSLT
jgi:hypothetical protein